MISKYESYPLSHIVSVQAIVSADYIQGLTPAINPHFHEAAWELCVCLGGETLLQKGDCQIALQAGELALVQPDCRHDVSTTKRDSVAFVVSFTCSDSSSQYLHLMQDALLPTSDTIVGLLENIKAELLTTFERTYEPMHLYQFIPSPDSPLGAEQMICCYLELTILNLLRAVTMDQGRVRPFGELRSALQLYLADQVTAYIQNHLHEKLSADSIAAHFHYSRSRLSTIYKSVTGLGLRERIIYERLELAKTMLAQGDKPIFQIAEELGFSSPHYFSHTFTEKVGCSPRAYANLIKKQEVR